VDQGAFHRSNRGRVKDLTPPAFPAPASRSRRPHVAPMAGDKVLFRALQASLAGSTASDVATDDSMAAREQVTFTISLVGFRLSAVFIRIPCLDLTIQARQLDSVCVASGRS